MEKSKASHEQILALLQKENEIFRDYYLWLIKAMPEELFDVLDQTHILLVLHNLMNFDVRQYMAAIQLKYMSIVMCLDEPNIDLEVLQNHSLRGIGSYQAFVSNSVPPLFNVTSNLRIIVINLYNAEEELSEPLYSKGSQDHLRALINIKYPLITESDFNQALAGISPKFLRSMPPELLADAIAMYSKATIHDQCQYEVNYEEDWELKNSSSMRIILAWKNTPKHNFLYRLMRVISRHNLVVKQISASHYHPYQTNSILLAVIELHGANNTSAWEAANILDFLKELITVKYFASFDEIDHFLIQKGVISGVMGNLLRAMENFIHQALVHIDPNLYTLERVGEALCRHPELTAQLCKLFAYKFDPEEFNSEKYLYERDQFLISVNKLDTGQQENDLRRKNVFLQGINFIHYTLKTNFYRPNYTALGFRLDPKYLDEIPFDRSAKFPEIPFGIFFIKGMHYIGFHIRFKDLARGGLRTVIPEFTERMLVERNNVFTECYNLAYTQHMKNKDIPEGGAKAILFFKPFERIESEAAIYKQEMQASKLDPSLIEKRIELFRQEQKLENLYEAQRSFIKNLILLVNCEPNGNLKAKYIIDYWKKPEYLYLGPDENMHDIMIEWIALYSVKVGYKPGSSFISGKPLVGINHKEYGVTSLGVNIYMDAVLRYLGMDPTKETFTVKMSGGPDGDVAGNQICNLAEYYPDTAKLLALTDVSGTIYDPKGLDLPTLVEMFKQGRSIRFYPPQKLNEGGFLVDKMTKRHQTALAQQTLCWRKKEDKLEEDWLSGSDMNYLLRHNVHQVPTDVFIPSGGRPRTLNESNYEDYLDPTGKPTSRAIVEGANLYLTPFARRALENLGVLVIKDSSANKTGVICSSFEVLSGLTLGDELFIANKEHLIQEILERLKVCASREANLLLNTHKETDDYLTDISDRISKRINQFTDQLLDYLESAPLSSDPRDPLIQSFLNYCLPTLRLHYQERLIKEIPQAHKKAIIACYIACNLVYNKGLSWFPTIVDILPVFLEQQEIQHSKR